MLFESHEAEFVESEAIATKNFDLDQTLTHFDIKRLVNLGPTILPRHLIHDDKVSRRMTHFLARYEYVYLFSDWVK